MKEQKNLTLPPGTMVDVDGYRLHVLSKGAGTPTVLIESGLAGGAMVWGRVQPALAEQVRVVSYDRAGYGWSDAGPRERTIEQMVTTLHTMLSKAGIGGPYVLVGHSFGGLIMRLFASRYPQEVVGLVLVDALSEYLFTRAPAIYRDWSRKLAGTFQRLQFIGRVGLLRALVWSGQAQLLPELVTRQPEEWQGPLLAGGFLSGRNFGTALSELTLLEPSMRHVQETTFPNDMPLIVFSHGRADMFSSLSKRDAQEAEQVWQDLQAQQAALSRQGKLLIAQKSGHDIHIDQPELVIAAVEQMVKLRGVSLLQ